MPEQLHFVVYIENHQDIPAEVKAMKIASENLAEDLKESGYNIIGVMSHGSMGDTISEMVTEDATERTLSEMDPIKQAEVIIEAHNLGEYEKTHKAEVKARAKEILDATQKTNFSAGLFEITTQAFIGRFIHNILKSSEPVDMRDCLWLMAIGYYLGTEGQKWLKKKT